MCYIDKLKNINDKKITKKTWGTQQEYSSKPLKHSIVKRVLVFKR